MHAINSIQDSHVTPDDDVLLNDVKFTTVSHVKTLHREGVNFSTFEAGDPMTSLRHSSIHSTLTDDVRLAPINCRLCSSCHTNHRRTVMRNSSDCHTHIVGLSCVTHRRIDTYHSSSDCHAQIVGPSCAYTWQYSGGTSATSPPSPHKTVIPIKRKTQERNSSYLPLRRQDGVEKARLPPFSENVCPSASGA